ncbi:MAG: cupredoxin domain-containing protein [Actinomycetota bacterium]|nr:cupredoxin domain-containing protein [Actinomycetota bacterium]
MATTVDEHPAAAPAEGGWTWRRLLTTVSIATVVGLVVLFVLAGIIPPLVVFAVLLIVGVVLLRTKTKAGAIMLLIIHLAMFATSLPFTIPSLGVPASAFDFGLTLYLAVVNLVGIGAAAAVIAGRGDEPSSAARTIGAVALIVILLGFAYAAYSSATYDSAVAQEGDVRLATQDNDYSDTSIEADEGTVSVFVDNKDGTTHTFTIDELDVDLEVPGGKTARIEFEAEQGSYEFYCVPHESEMAGNISVE